MECNKDEALRARKIAEARMQRGEFQEALKFATKAKNLYPDVGSISHVLAICEVHNAAKRKLSPSDMDWYAILQIERLADETAIKKQYRRLALLLHPDKNKFSGAETAFKLVGQANGVLSDQAKRSLYDKKFAVSVSCPVPKSTDSKKKPGQKTFWTCCQHCNTKYQFCMPFVNATIRCKQCLKSFKACAIPLVNIQKESPTHGPPKPASESTGSKPPGGGEHASTFMKKCSSGVGGHSEGAPASTGAESQTSKNVGSKRVRQSAPDSGESFKAGKWL
ncbi:hypothetical protein PHAVU_007G183700 [Phaseolus vulgaris]|uniref:J domain-containing protein n=1 Tax=Phaseolus vulgaris TaxID=3885 RepID=V7BGX7_PHAVU|nr:hypothetical protein PHAVU_007G183700g [Phaseolus vulgaris]XP_007144777.1 hypothetical protein PHAVU_007G183700g [Phaseolus vulgaris]ESW16770.1 hypothetical protein PHAVU_007G183700g [Phaseolus vulgaris]ESW16771.1 hypothetical protein PHAVU_007G183700g [Phaseolus vulgaris]